jgi:hypothetical protein
MSKSTNLKPLKNPVLMNLNISHINEIFLFSLKGGKSKNKEIFKFIKDKKIIVNINNPF